MLIIKLLTLNTHSLIENNYKTKLKIFTDAILQEKPDIIALQEVNQTIKNQNRPQKKISQQIIKSQSKLQKEKSQ